VSSQSSAGTSAALNPGLETVSAEAAGGIDGELDPPWPAVPFRLIAGEHRGSDPAVGAAL
jgi:hypothetical protein